MERGCRQGSIIAGQSIPKLLTQSVDRILRNIADVADILLNRPVGSPDVADGAFHSDGILAAEIRRTGIVRGNGLFRDTCHQKDQGRQYGGAVLPFRAVPHNRMPALDDFRQQGTDSLRILIDQCAVKEYESVIIVPAASRRSGAAVTSRSPRMSMTLCSSSAASTSISLSVRLDRASER